MGRVRVLRVGCLAAVTALAAACTSSAAVKPATTLADPTSTTLAVATLLASPPPPNALISCSGRRYTALSFAGMRIDYEVTRSPLVDLKRFDVYYRGRSVFKTSNIYFAEPIDAPGTTGYACIAKIGERGSPVALTDEFAGSEGLTGLQVVYPVSSGRSTIRTFYFPGALPFDIRILGGSLAVVGGDTRFSFLFTDGAGSNSPIVVDRFEGDQLVDVSTRFPQLIAADAARLVASTRQQWYLTDPGWAFVGVLESWVADECRLGKAPQAWPSAEQQVTHGRYRRFMAEYVPGFIQQLKADLVRWRYCPAAD
jgi:hypothetical protein